MNKTFTAASAREQAIRLTDFLATIKRKISLGHALEAVARIHGEKSWNVLSAQLEKRASEVAPVAESYLSVSQVSASPYVLVKNGTAPVQLKIRAEVRTDDGRREVSFDASPWFSQALDEEIIALADIDWAGDYAADSVAEYIRDKKLDEDVLDLFDYHEKANEALSTFDDPVGYEVFVGEGDAMRYLRAFRYALFVRFTLENHWGSLERALKEGFGVIQDTDNERTWRYCYFSEIFSITYSSEQAAWEELGKRMECLLEQFHLDEELLSIIPFSGVLQFAEAPVAKLPGKVAGRFDEETGTGAVLVLAPGDKHLSYADLQKITGDGQYPIAVAVPVDIGKMIDEDIEWLNDFVSEAITGSEGDLSGLQFSRYTPKSEGTLIDTQTFVYILVIATWDPLDINSHDSADNKQA